MTSSTDSTTRERSPRTVIVDAITSGTFAVATDELERAQAADAVAVFEAATVGAQAAMLALLEHLDEFNTNCARCTDLDNEIKSLLAVAREARSTT